MNDLNPADLVSPPSWALQLGELGRILVLAAAALFALSAISWLFSKRSPALERAGKLSFGAACCSVLGAFVSLVILFANNRFEFEYVFGHADSHNALAYRIAGIWSGQEGSFLLWATCSAIFALFTVGNTGIYRRWYSITFAFFLGGIASILAFESPFKLNLFEGRPFVPEDGLGLAPSLQNYWVIIHPPTIFLGFGSLTALFALAFAALAVKDYEGWVPIVRPWAIVSASLVGLGLCMGGFWAYETLGWGGFWMWDPVENVSFVPWCFTIALIHGIIVQAARKKWQQTNLLLGALPFVVFIYGTFLTRSGLLSDASVHSFAEMDRSALKLLIVLMAGTTFGFAGLWGFRAFQGRKTAPVAETGAGLKREAFYIVGIGTMLLMGIATAIGMSVPLVQALKGEKPRVVEEALYHQVLPFVFIPLMLLMAVTPFVSWRGMTPKAFWSKVYTVFCITVGLTGLVLFLAVITPIGKTLNLSSTVNMLGRFEVRGLPWLMFLVGICIFPFVGNVMRIAELFKGSKMGTMPFVTHIGVAMLMAGLIISRGFEQKAQSVVMKDRPGRLMNYEVRYAGMTSNENDRNNQLKLDIYNPHAKGAPLFTATPGLYKVKMADGQESTMVWPHIERGWLMDTYVSLGQPQTDATQDVELKPGETTQFGGLGLTYVKMTRKGQFGQPGTRFGALVKISAKGQSTTINPEMEIVEGGETVFHPAKLGENMELAMAGMNAANKSVTLRVQFMTPIYPIEIYHKPMTILVWLGTGIMTLAGFASAFYRRSRRAVAVVEEPIAPKKTKRAADLVTAIKGETT